LKGNNSPQETAMLKPLSVQLYSLRDAARQDFDKVLQWVADVGYKGVEPAGMWDMRPSEFKKRVNDLGLELYSSHTPWARSGNLGECMEIASILGIDKIVCGYGPNEFKDMDAIKATAEATNRMQAVLARNGFTLFQHNHDFEFQRLDGRVKYEIYRELCPNLKFQIDCFWSTNRGQEDPVAMLKSFAADTILLHMKDGVTLQEVSGDKMVDGFLDRKVEMRALGQGDLPIRELIATMPDSVETVIVELDYCNTDMFDAIAESYRFMTSNGLAAGNK
jgi:sugar phosphate isomerase/epimerase